MRAAAKLNKEPNTNHHNALEVAAAIWRAWFGVMVVGGIGANGCVPGGKPMAKLGATMPKVPHTPLANNQELSARLVAQRIAPLSRAVLRFIGPQARVVTQPPTNREINKARVDQIPTLPAMSGVMVLGAPDVAIVLAPMAPNKELKIN
jgi:hypothetical protein